MLEADLLSERAFAARFKTSRFKVQARHFGIAKG
jgi:hypothetical protein